MTLARQRRASHAACVVAADAMKLSKRLRVGQGYAQVHDMPSLKMKGELFEALLGAVYQDAGFMLGKVRGVYEAHAAPKNAA